MPEFQYYTVGWICALTTEYVAAQLFLDEVHQRPEYLPKNDTNDYTLGRIGAHNVVIGVLPLGEYGVSSATGVVKSMIRSFPNIRVGLLVGIGSGAPSRKNDIRLGDVVVSTPREGSGVVQYDYEKTTQSQTLVLTGSLNQPPDFMLTAVSGLIAQYEMEGHTIKESINKVLEAKPRLRKKYQQPNACTDKLFKSEVVHQDTEAMEDCFACGVDSSQVVSRPERTEYEDDPSIHCGTVASSGHYLRDAVIRDKIARESNVLCFETEAAGLMNRLSCLVIRGICDYADTHSNDKWQGYAAMTAAAYAQDLLKRIPPNQVEAEKKIHDILVSVETDLRETKSDVKHLVFNEQQARIKKWLSAPDPSTNYNTALQRRENGTGNWLLEHDKFLRWKAQRNSFLLLHGTPGCGKTILSTTVIETLKTLDQPLIYFYFVYNDTHKQTLENFVRFAISELYFTIPGVQVHLDFLVSACERDRVQPSCESLCKVLVQMIEGVREDVWIVLDALDECNTLTHQGLLSWINSVLKLEQSNIHLLATSRPEQDVMSRLCDRNNDDRGIQIQSELIKSDIRAYIRSRVADSDGFARWKGRDGVHAEIERVLMEKANNMFQWVACQIDALEKCLTFSDLKAALNSLPATLNATYRRILQAIPREYKQKAIRILQLLVFSAQPLTVPAIVDAIAVRLDRKPHFSVEDRLVHFEDIKRYCSSLVIVAKVKRYWSHAQEVQLAHFSVKEYLMSTQEDEEIKHCFQEKYARASLASTCIAYLLDVDYFYDESKSNPTISGYERAQEIGRKFPFVQYSTDHWAIHARLSDEEGKELNGFIECILLHNKAAYEFWTSLLPRNRLRNYYIGYLNFSALYYAASWGLRKAVALLLESGPFFDDEDKNLALGAASIEGYEQIVRLLLAADAMARPQSQDPNIPPALFLASEEGHESIVKLLLDAGAEVDDMEPRGSALQTACHQGHDQVVRMLLQAGADVNQRSIFFDSPLPEASARGYTEIVRMLLHEGANVDYSSNHGNPLDLACRGGHEEIVEILLKNGADFNVHLQHPFDPSPNPLQTALGGGHDRIARMLLDKGALIYNTALHDASLRGYHSCVETLLNKGADVNARGGKHGTALNAASVRGHDEIVKTLVDHGAEVNVITDFGSALGCAAYSGNMAILKRLLDAGADIDAQSRIPDVYQDYGTALQIACHRGHENVVHFLINEGANVNAQGGSYGTALQAVSFRKQNSIATLLIDKGADVNMHGKHFGSALQAACSNYFSGSYLEALEIVTKLLDSGADVNAQGGSYGNALQAASRCGGEEIVRLLLEKGADVNAQGSEFGTALQAASYYGNKEIVRLLLEKGADVNVQGGEFGTALQAASSSGREEIVRLLLEKGADVNVQGGEFGTALQAASYRGDEEIVRLLLEKGADINAKGGIYGSALKAAMRNRDDSPAVVELLLEYGADPSELDVEQSHLTASGS